MCGIMLDGKGCALRILESATPHEIVGAIIIQLISAVDGGRRRVGVVVGVGVEIDVHACGNKEGGSSCLKSSL